MAAHSFHVLFCVVFQNFYAILQKLINTSMSKIIAADLNVLPLGYTTATLRYPPLPAPFDFHAPSVKSFNRKRRHIGIRIVIRIIYYPINRSG